MSTPPSAADEQRRVDFATRVAMWIAAMSVVSAVAGWEASQAGIKAANLERRLIQERIQTEAEEGHLRAEVTWDRALLARYQEHVLAAHLLDRDAQDAYKNNHPDRGATLEMQAQGELALARALIPLFRAQYPDWPDTRGMVEYDHVAELNRLRATDRVLQRIQPDQTERQVEKIHDRTLRLYAVAASFVLAVFFLTMAEFGPPSASTYFARAGTLVIVVGSAGWIWIEVLAR